MTFLQHPAKGKGYGGLPQEAPLSPGSDQDQALAAGRRRLPSLYSYHRPPPSGHQLIRPRKERWPIQLSFAGIAERSLASRSLSHTCTTSLSSGPLPPKRSFQRTGILCAMWARPPASSPGPSSCPLPTRCVSHPRCSTTWLSPASLLANRASRVIGAASWSFRLTPNAPPFLGKRWGTAAMSPTPPSPWSHFGLRAR